MNPQPKKLTKEQLDFELGDDPTDPIRCHIEALESENEELRRSLEEIASYALTVRTDRMQGVNGDTMCLQTLEWCEGLIERAEQAEAALTPKEPNEKKGQV